MAASYSSGTDKGLLPMHGKHEIDQISVVPVEADHLLSTIPPHESYEAFHRYSPGAEWTKNEEASLVRKTDLYLLSWICLMVDEPEAQAINPVHMMLTPREQFFGLQLDRGNLSNALTDNLLVDLKLTSNDYNNGTTIQLLCFLAAEFPVQLLTKRFGFRHVLPTMMMLWGTVSWAQSWMHDRTSFYITRALIGACEGGFIPGTILFATYFYTSRELSVRLACFWSTLNIARVISSLLAAGILSMRGVGGKPGWFWLFLIEGLLTFVIGFARILRDDPAKGLTALKQAATFRDILNAWKDSSMWGLYFIGLIAYIPATPVQAYLSLTLKRIGFSTFNSNMLSIPSAVLQIILMLALAWSSERFGERTFHCFFGEFWCFPLLAALLALPSGGRNWPRFAITTMISGYPYFHPIVSAWISENSFDVQKRAITAATYNVIVQIGSVIGSQIYRADDSPYYYRGNKGLISICALALVTFVAQREYLRYLNRRKEKLWSVMTVEDRVAYQSDREERESDGNRRLDFNFRY
ncbi:hypothetical protein B0A49_05634 [Cryomyces minteri]|uniref:Major facilitator superfamily (MFS) profile domain-containing protein n=1 Tax=Cryomyces minteri TaxID=331657 RepID=A0A4U0X735_9PEZI|nr:hypothetical protein B0A49_05634 [Cryomyces minteri]